MIKRSGRYHAQVDMNSFEFRINEPGAGHFLAKMNEWSLKKIVLGRRK
jgi:hypothetical protein